MIKALSRFAIRYGQHPNTMLASFDNWVPAGHDVVGHLPRGRPLTDFRPLMAAMGPNVAGVIGTAIATGVFLALLK